MALFSLTFLWYVIILFVNISLIVIIIMDKHLHEPMYIFLCNLCINGLYGTAGFYPKFLWDLLTSHVISYAQCMLQGFVVHSSSCGDLSMLASVGLRQICGYLSAFGVSFSDDKTEGLCICVFFLVHTSLCYDDELSLPGRDATVWHTH